ncbi:hypothetical protein LVD17_01105 [Fulvivirga ulvae]|uniref:hypothetical protein n=1 Tax=Fulvivirga ulvae TaxID=2904245 RepID=UPI001F33BA8C|nr:hypothetical protein [Fulvivirga ulvae]UII32437.1 hypothetical protein LVD17_01105 [Fulvivirga ulvae]
MNDSLGLVNSSITAASKNTGSYSKPGKATLPAQVRNPFGSGSYKLPETELEKSARSLGENPPQPTINNTIQMLKDIKTFNPSRNNAADARPVTGIVDPVQMVTATPSSGRPIQMKRGKLVEARGFSPWFWTDTLEANWKRNKIPIHPCHSRRLSVNQLYGGYTLIDEVGETIVSQVYGPYTPRLGSKKSGHVERQFIAEMENHLYASMQDDSRLGDDVLALIEIKQWFTPCSGSVGCATTLNDKINEYHKWFEEISAGGRFSAGELYESGVAETHPKRPGKARKTSIDDEEMYDFEGNVPSVIHINPGDKY